MSRSSIKKAVLKNFAIFTEKHLRWSFFLNKNADLQPWNFIKKRLKHRFFPVNITKILRAPVLENICQRLFELFPTWASNITSNVGIVKRTFSEKQNMGIEEEIFSKTKKPFKIYLGEKNLPFHDALDHFFFLCISTACPRRRLPYITKDDRSVEL